MKKPTKSIITSSLLAVAFGALSVSTTFALFTSQSQTEINVGTGIVNVESRATLVSYQSTVEGETVYQIDGNEYSNPLIGNRFALDGNIINIDKMVPGDVLTLKLSAVNKSNVKTKTRLVINHATVGTKTDLYPALDLDFSVPNAGNPANLFKWTTHDAVAEADMAQGVALYDDLTVKITFPDGDNGEILFGAANHDNQYQDAACSIAFGLEAVQGNAATSPIDEINAYLQAEMIIEGQNKTMYEAVQDMKEIEFNDLSVLHYNNVNYVYSLDADQFVAENTVTSNYHRYFKVYSAMPGSQTFSIYAANNWATANVALNGVGFDAGDASGIATVSYAGLGEENARTNIVRTNALTTSVTVDAPFDVINHYGQAGSLNLIAVANSSYHEFGTIAFTEVKQGRIVLEKTAKVDQIHIVANNTAPTLEQEAFLEVIIEDNGVLPANMPAKITRDAVTVGEENLVVKVITAEEKVENVYVYPYTNTVTETPTGTTQKTEEHNTNVNSTLGALVLDNGSGQAGDGEKALSTEEKGVAKEKVVTEAIQTACEHTHTHYELNLNNFLTHKQICNDCGKVLADNLPHEYDAEHADTCIHCGYSQNEIVLNVSSTTALSAAINAYNNNTLPDTNYVIELEDGIYNVEPNYYEILQSKINMGKTLTIRAKNIPTAKDGDYKVTIKPNFASTRFKNNNGSQFIFGVSGGSSFNNGGAILIKGIAFDMRCNDITNSNYIDARLNIVFCLSGNTVRYAHNITVDTCYLEANGGKLASFISANKGNTSAKDLAVTNCYGKSCNCFMNVYADNLLIKDCMAKDMLVIVNVQASSTHLEVNNVNGDFFAQYQKWGGKPALEGGTEKGVVCTKGGTISISNCEITTNKPNAKAGIFYANEGTNVVTMTNLTIHKYTGEWQFATYDAYCAKDTTTVNGETVPVGTGIILHN